MFAETTAAITAAKEAYALIKTLKEARDQSAIDSVTGQLHEKITELQMLNAELASLYHSERQVAMKLADENTKINAFASQSGNYDIHTMESGSTVYRLKISPESQVKTHYLCANCHHNRSISILQPTGEMTHTINGRFFESRCPACKTTILMHKAPKEKAEYIPLPIKRGGW